MRGHLVCTDTVYELMRNPKVKQELDNAFQDSLPNEYALRHEEGGWVFWNPRTSGIQLRRARPGQRGYILLKNPPVENMGVSIVIATFHTHPNPRIDEKGQGWLSYQPSIADQDLADNDYNVPDLIIHNKGILPVLSNGRARRTQGLIGRNPNGSWYLRGPNGFPQKNTPTIPGCR
jgi:hypothetical protein